MSVSANITDELFDGGPLLRWERSLRLVKPGRPRAARRTLIVVLITWVPLAVLTTAQFLIFADESAKSFFSAIAVQIRFLVAVPALIFAEAECIPRLGRIVTLRDLIGPIAVSALLPFIPVALLAMPLEVILRALVKLLF